MSRCDRYFFGKVFEKLKQDKKTKEAPQERNTSLGATKGGISFSDVVLVVSKGHLTNSY